MKPDTATSSATGHAGERRRGRPRRGDRPDEDPSADQVSTREKILEVALELFADQGYDQTSLREIAQRLGLTKAALYYHFASKDEILMALHVQLHELLDDVLEQFGDETVPPDSWPAVFNSFIDKILEHRKLLLMHERNQTAFQKLHAEAHVDQHSDIEQKLGAVLADPDIPARRRIRIGCAFAMVMGGLLFGKDAFTDISDVDLATEIKAAVDDLLD